MTRTEHRNVVAEVLELLIERGFEGMAQAIQILLNEGMKLEREEFLGACLHERTAERRGHANGYKPKKLRSRLGELGLEIPQVRDVLDGESFYPSALERGERSERALKLARNSADSRSQVPRSRAYLKGWTRSLRSGARDHWGKTNTSCSMLATRRCATAAR